LLLYFFLYYFLSLVDWKKIEDVPSCE